MSTKCIGTPGPRYWTRSRASFTLVELLTVIAIIAILVALVFAAGTGVIVKGLRSRASTEIQAISGALESYKTDNGIYVQSDGTLATNNYTADSSAALTTYQNSSIALFTNLAGVNYFGQSGLNTSGGNNVKVYMSFKANQVANPTGPLSYIKDPWNAPYGYSTGISSSGTYTATPYNGAGLFDLWSTAGLTGAKVGNTNTWISNWTQ